MKILIIVLLTTLSISACKIENKTSTKPIVNWVSIAEVQKKMKTEPRKVLIDIYAEWCGPCKRMSKYTFTDKNVVEIINEKFYAVKFNAEQLEDVDFLGETYINKGRAHDFALQLGATSRGLSYPTIIYFDEDFKKIQSIPGYYEAQEYISFLKYFGNNHYKTTSLNQFIKNH